MTSKHSSTSCSRVYFYDRKSRIQSLIHGRRHFLVNILLFLLHRNDFSSRFVFLPRLDRLDFAFLIPRFLHDPIALSLILIVFYCCCRSSRDFLFDVIYLCCSNINSILISFSACIDKPSLKKENSVVFTYKQQFTKSYF